jgi:hypothetical protein
MTMPSDAEQILTTLYYRQHNLVRQLAQAYTLDGDLRHWAWGRLDEAARLVNLGRYSSAMRVLDELGNRLDAADSD